MEKDVVVDFAECNEVAFGSFPKGNDPDLKSIHRAEKRKAKLENSGYSLERTQRLGVDRYRLCYRGASDKKTRKEKRLKALFYNKIKKAC